MKKIFTGIISTLLLISTFSVSAEYSSDFNSEYHMDNVEAFIDSPDMSDLESIGDETKRYCEQVYLEATRRREYTEVELQRCGDFFEMKREQEMDYMRYMFKNRELFY